MTGDNESIAWLVISHLLGCICKYSLTLLFSGCIFGFMIHVKWCQPRIDKLWSINYCGGICRFLPSKVIMCPKKQSWHHKYDSSYYPKWLQFLGDIRLNICFLATRRGDLFSRFLEKLKPKIRADLVSELMDKVLECIDAGLRDAHDEFLCDTQWPSSWKNDG